MAKNPVKITDTTFRDGHQCTLATRMRTADLEPIAEKMDEAGFHSVEMWGGATFDVATRFLAEDPWERVRSLKKLMPKTPFQMLLRGQNLVGYRNYPDDLVQAFVDHSCEVGIDIFRIFDALNDPNNLDFAVKVVKQNGKHAQLAISYSVTEGRLGGDIYNIEYYVSKALVYQQLGADSICIKDMAGIMSPYDAEILVNALKPKLDVPLHLHTHYTSGMASMAVLKAIEAGIDGIDTCLAPLSLRASQPAVEPIVVTLRGTDRDSGLDLDYLLELGRYFEDIGSKYREYLDTTKLAPIDTNVLEHQIPGGMISNLIAQLKEANALDRLHEVYQELPKLRKDMGNPPLVTPSSQIVGVQAVNNVIFGRYKMITDQVKDYLYGMYGVPPGKVSAKLVKEALRDYPGGNKPIKGRAADTLGPELDKAKEDTKDIAKDIGDVLIYGLFPTTGMRYLRWKYGLEQIPDEVKGEPATFEGADVAVSPVKQDPVPKPAPTRTRVVGPRTFNVTVGDQQFSVEVAAADETFQRVPNRPSPVVRAQQVPPPPTSPVLPAEAPAPAAPPPTAAVTAGETAVTAPIPGLVIRYTVAEGDRVNAGDTVVILEAMKMENALPAQTSGVVKKLSVVPGTKVAKDDVLAVIG